MHKQDWSGTARALTTGLTREEGHCLRVERRLLSVACQVVTMHWHSYPGTQFLNQPQCARQCLHVRLGGDDQGLSMSVGSTE